MPQVARPSLIEITPHTTRPSALPDHVYAVLKQRILSCDLRPGEVLERGGKFGMIKLGSRTELILAEHEGLRVAVKVGDRVKAGVTVMARNTAESR